MATTIQTDVYDVDIWEYRVAIEIKKEESKKEEIKEEINTDLLKKTFVEWKKRKNKDKTIKKEVSCKHIIDFKYADYSKLTQEDFNKHSTWLTFIDYFNVGNFSKNCADNFCCHYYEYCKWRNNNTDDKFNLKKIDFVNWSYVNGFGDKVKEVIVKYAFLFRDYL